MSGRFSIEERASSLRHAWRGARAVVRSEHNAWIHLGATVAVIAAGVVLGVSRLEWGLLALAMAAVWSAEAMNTAVEALGNALSPDRSEPVGRAKDVAAGAVLLAALGAVVVGMLVFGPRLLRFFASLG